MTDTNSTAHTVDTARTDSSASESAESVVGQIPRGATLGRYVVLDLLGAGGMGVVHTAYDPELDRKVALKLLRTDHAVGRARLLREAQALARLAHPNVVAVHDVGATEQHVFIAMEFIHGVTLARHLEAHTLAWPEVLELFVAVGRGLAAAHAAGLVHRDLKPDNVMVGGDGRVRVLDFGLARASLARSDAGEESPTASALDVSLTHPGKLLGTPKYMAPEQWLAVAVDARTDQFALCVMLWHALFGEPPFAGDSVPALMRNVVEGRLSAPSRPARAHEVAAHRADLRVRPRLLGRRGRASQRRSVAARRERGQAGGRRHGLGHGGGVRLMERREQGGERLQPLVEAGAGASIQRRRQVPLDLGRDTDVRARPGPLGGPAVDPRHQAIEAGRRVIEAGADERGAQRGAGAIVPVDLDAGPQRLAAGAGPRARERLPAEPCAHEAADHQEAAEQPAPATASPALTERDQQRRDGGEARGEARSRLARALWDRAGAGDRTRARDLAAAALTDLRAGGESMAEDIAELEAWVAVVERSCPSGNCGKSR